MTTPPALATVADLEAWLGATIDPDGDALRARAVLGAASALVRQEAGKTWLDDAGALDAVPEPIKITVVQCAARVFRNPSGAVQHQAGPFSARYTEAAGEGLYLTDTEKAMIRGPKSNQLSTVRVQVPAAAAGVPRVWCDLESDTAST